MFVLLQFYRFLVGMGACNALAQRLALLQILPELKENDAVEEGSWTLSKAQLDLLGALLYHREEPGLLGLAAATNFDADAAIPKSITMF